MLISHFNRHAWIKAAAFYLRMQVFVQEQGIPLQAEFDELDSDAMTYLVIFDDDKPVGTARYLQDDAQTLRLDRLCVHIDYRQQGIGQQLVRELEQQGQLNNCLKSCVHSEKHAIPFYKKLGYSVCSDDFMEDGILCTKLEKRLLS
ncbi:hypothetical protein CBF34_01455 [Vagococcus penaei]|nr:GNAT family N-acetyltransferase [Vagococcus penaei]RSU06774.1 hypothetical protein CBF34_01455 [Vagococcus penaei]